MRNMLLSLLLAGCGGTTPPPPCTGAGCTGGPTCALVEVQPDHAIGWRGGGQPGGIDCWVKFVIDDTSVRVGDAVEKGEPPNDFVQCAKQNTPDLMKSYGASNIAARTGSESGLLVRFHVPATGALCADKIVGAACGCTP